MIFALAVFALSAGFPAMGQTAPATKDDPTFENAYQKFQTGYRLGTGDILAVRVQGHPQYSREALKVSPVGAIYLELLGEVGVAGMTLQQTRDYLTKELSEYLNNPQVSVSLVEAVSAKIAILGDVLRPGIVVMARPMNLLDAITEAGGFAPTGSKSNVELIRNPTGGSKSKRVNVGKILAGKAAADENVQLQPGDIVYVHGNMLKTVANITSLAGFGGFTTFMTLGRQTGAR
jgi:polysaccharide biosynthesis/export protein